MKTAVLTGLAAACLAAAPLAAPAMAHGYSVGDITIDHPWARPTVALRQPAAAYFTLRNDGDTPDRLIAAEPLEFAESAELHTHINDDGIMRMRPAADGVVIPAGETVAFEPGGLHVMLFGLAAPLAEGELHRLRLIFEDAGAVEVGVFVETGADGHHHH